MISITGAYLIAIIERNVNRTICIRRNHPVQAFTIESVYDTTNEEIADFILSIPYFDEGIKNFILEISNEKTDEIASIEKQDGFEILSSREPVPDEEMIIVMSYQNVLN